MAGNSEAVSGKERLQNLLNHEEKILRRIFSANITDVKSLFEGIGKLGRYTNGGDDTYNLKMSLGELRDIAYETEDLLDELRFLSGKYGRQGTGFLSRAMRSIKYLSARCRVFMQVREMRARLHAISWRNSTMINFSDRETPANLTRYRLDKHQLAPLFFEEAELVGTDEPKRDVIQLLMAKETKLKVISVVGMCGSGKTALLRSVFNHEKVQGSFKGGHVWIILTAEYSTKGLLRSTLNQISEEMQEPMPESTDFMDKFQLVEMIRCRLRDRKYIIVFDDVWCSDFWEYFRDALPDDNCGSRIVVASRSAQVVSAFKISTDNSSSEAKKGLDSDSKDVPHYYVNPLPHNYAWSLFCKKAFQSESCPQELESLSWEIIDKCSGLPLLIVTIGGLLSTKERNVKTWKGILESLDWENGSTEFKHVMRIEKAKIPQVEHAMVLAKDECLKVEHVFGVRETEHVIVVEKATSPEMEHVGKMNKIKVPRLEHVMRILSISYKDLPDHLKSCLLYFNMFPRNFSIKCATLIRLWIAEGFVRSEEGNTLEEIARGYLDELIQRSMVQVSEFYDYGRARSCRIHNHFRDIIILKFDKNFGTSLTREIKMIEGTVRRLSVLGANDDLLQNMRASYLRALLFVGSNAVSFPSVLDFFSRFKLLRILDLEGAPIETLTKDLGNLIHLRYLSLRNTSVSKLPKSLKRLINLQTLDLKGTYVSELPSQIIKLKSLRHLLAYRYYIGREPPYYYALGIKLPQGIGKLGELQKLIYIDVNQESGMFGELARLTQLRRLGIINLRKQDGENFCLSVSKMKELRALSVSSIYIDEQYKHEQLDLRSFAPPEKLERLYLRGPLENLPPWVSSLNQLVRLQLRWSNLAEDSLEVLHVLPHLIELTLMQAYEGRRLSFNQGFPALKILSLDRLAKLERVNLEGAMPNLQKIYIRSCKQLITVPEGIEQCSSLKELHLFDMQALMHILGEGEAESLKVKNIPVIRSYRNQDRAYRGF